MARRLLVWMLAMAMTLSGLPLAACAETEITWLIGVPIAMENWGSDLVSRAMMNAVDIRVHVVSVDNAQKQLLDILMAGDAPPELITWHRDAYQVEQLARQGKIWNLDELARRNGASMDHLLGAEIAQSNRDENGNLYLCPGMVCESGEDAVSDGSRLPCMLVREDLLQRFSQMDFTRPDAFLEALADMATDEAVIPLGLMPFTDEGCLSIDGYLREALAFAPVRDGVYEDWLQSEDSREWLFVLSQANARGYLDENVFTCDRDQIARNLSMGRYGAYMGDASLISHALQSARDRGFSYAVVNGPRNRNRNAPRHSLDCVRYGMYATMISVDSAHPDAAMALMAWMLSADGQRMVDLGVQGSMWSEQNGEAVLRASARQLYEKSVEQFRAVYGGGGFYAMLMMPAMREARSGYSLEVLAQSREYMKEYGVDASEERGILLRAQHAMLAESCLLRRCWGDALPKILCATNREEFDRELDAYFLNRQAEGYERYVQAIQDAAAFR